MNVFRYLVLSQQFCEENAGYRIGPCIFGYGVTKDGTYVTSINSLQEFPALFEGVPIIPVDLSSQDFD